MNKPVVVSQNTVAQELSSSKNRDLVALVEKTKNATEKGTDSIRTLRHYSEANALSRMWNDKKIKLSTVTAIESVHELTQVSLVLTKINHDMAFELGGAVDRLEASDDAIKKVQQELRLQQEAIAETLKKDRERGQLIDLLMESDDELLQDLNAMRRDLKALGADNLADQLDSFTRQLIQNTRAIEGVEKENKKLKHMLDKSTEELILHIKAVSELSVSNVTALERNSNISLKNQISILKDNLKTTINMNQAATNKGFWWVCIVLFLNVIATIVVFLGVFG